MDNNENLTQDFFISDDGYINLRLKVTTNDITEREKLVASLMGRLRSIYDDFDVFSAVEVDEIYLHNSSPKSVIEKIKEDALSKISESFDDIIRDNNL